MEDDNDKHTLVMSRNDSEQTLDIDCQLKKQQTKKILFTLYFVMFTGSVGFSVMMSSMWPFMRTIDKTVTETFYGWVNAAYSLAMMVFSIIFGYWCDKRSSKEPLMASFILMITGYIVYAYAQREGGLWFVLAGRLIAGCGAGNVAVARTLGAHLTSVEERAKVLSYLTMAQATGFLIGPLFQAASKFAGDKVYNISLIKLKLSIYTIPCLFMILLVVINLILVLVYLRKMSCETTSHKKEELTSNFEPVDMYAVCACIGLWFVGMSIFSLNESILSPILMNEYAWSREETTFYGAVILSCMGLQSTFLYIAVVPLCKRFTERIVVVYSFFLMLLGFVFYLPWGPGNLKIVDFGNSTIVDNGGGGCPSTYDWCYTTPKLPFPQLIVGIFLFNTGYPLGIVMVNVLYSKIIGPFQQGRYMAWLSGLGSLSRVVGPLYITAIYKHFGLRWSATSTIIILFATIVTIWLCWRRLVPYASGRKTVVC